MSNDNHRTCLKTDYKGTPTVLGFLRPAARVTVRRHCPALIAAFSISAAGHSVAISSIQSRRCR